MVHPIGKRVFKLLVYPYMKKITGLANIPKDTGFIIAANHASYMDHLIISTIFVNHLNKKVHFLAKKEHFDNWYKKAFHKWADAIPIDRKAGGKDALKWAVRALKKGKVISIHPEGTRSTTGKLLKAKTGIVRLALAAKVPVLPVGLIGTYDILPKGKLIPKLKRAEMHIGKLMYFDEYYGKENDYKVLRSITTKIMKEIAKLSKKKYNFR